MGVTPHVKTTIVTCGEIDLSITISFLPTQSYARVSGLSSTYIRSGDASASVREASGASASSTVSLSAAAEQAAKNDVSTRLKLPDASYWMRQDFPEDILAEAKARLAERQAAPGIGDGYLPSSISNLPLLPENQALLDRFRQEMKEIGHDNSDPEKNARFNRLLNLSLRVQIEGWKAPMSEADAQRELDIQQAMAVIDTGNTAQNAVSGADVPFDPLAGWKLRWQQEGLTMPSVDVIPGNSLWLDLADKAGISQDEFVAKARDLATHLKGNALTQAVEQFISDRYLAAKNASAKA